MSTLEEPNDIQCERIGNLVYIKCDNVVIMVATVIKEKKMLIHCNNLSWMSFRVGDKTKVEQMETEVKKMAERIRRRLS